MRNITEIIVHCSATPEGREHTVADIDSWHRKRGWSGIGYHYVVHLDGKVSKGRPIWKRGAHVAGRNTGTIGIVYIGGMDKNMKKPKDTRTPAQKRALVDLMSQLMLDYPKITKISGHNQYSNKACPSFNAGKEYMALTDAVEKVIPRKAKTLAKSRTVKGGAVVATAGISQMIEPIKEASAVVMGQQDQMSNGGIVALVLGSLVVGGALVALYARWDDAGRPIPWR